MPTSAVETFGKVDLKDAVVLVAFPTTGSAASIAAQYLVKHLGLPLVGHMRLPELAGFVNIQAGQVTGLVRIHGGDVDCKVGKNCPRLYVVTSDLGLPPKAALAVADAILSWAAKGAYLVLVLEGVVRMEGDETPDVYAGSPDASMLGVLRKAGIRPVERALLGGLGAQVLLDAAPRGVRAATILVEANKDHPDGRAATALVEAVSLLMPGMQIDSKPLAREALQLEEEIKRAQRQAEPRPPHTLSYI